MESEDMQRMEMAAEEAAAELKAMVVKDPDLGKAIVVLAAWWHRWFMKAGHKRLGRIIAANR